MRTCPSCHTDWPDDRFRPEFSDCFRCRAGSTQFNYGARGRENFHGHTVKEFNDRQVREARANGIEAVPARTASTGVPTKRLMADLKKTLAPKGK